MNRYAKTVVIILLIGAAFMVYGQVWYMQASMDYTKSMQDQNRGLEINAWDRMSWATMVYNFGVTVVVVGIIVLVIGMIAPRPAEAAPPPEQQPEQEPEQEPEQQLEELEQLEDV